MGYRVGDGAAAESFAAGRTTTRKLAAVLGHPERGERLIAALDREIGAPGNRDGAARDLDGSAPTALYFQRRGFANGADSLMSEILAAAGLRNAAGELGLERPGRVELETVVSARPDRSEEHTSELLTNAHLVCRLLLEQNKQHI